MSVRIRTGRVAGRSHRLFGKNCQDAFSVEEFERNDSKYFVGVVADGCGEGKNSELAAILTSQFLTCQITHLVKNLTDEYQGIYLLQQAYKDLIRVLRNIFMEFWYPPSRGLQFLKDNLLATAVGFLSGPEETFVFIAGDGVVVVNDQVRLIQQDDRPLYPGYHLVGRSSLQTNSTLPSGFTVYTYKTSQISRLAVGTDAWIEEPELLEKIWGFKNPAGLQRQMNVWSEREHRFQDDATIITLEIEKEEENADVSDRREERPPDPA